MLWVVTMLLWGAWLLGLQLSAAHSALNTLSGEALVFDVVFWGVVLPGAVVAFAMVGLVLATRWPQNVIGWLCLALALAVVVHTAAFDWSQRTYESAPGSLPWGGAAVLISVISGELMLPLPLTLIVLTFPSGQLGLHAGRPVAWLALAGTFIAMAGQATSIRIYAGDHSAIYNPLGFTPFPPGVPEAAVQLGDGVGVVGLLLAVVGLVVRTRSARGAEKLQLKWFAAVGATAMGVLAIAGLGQLIRIPWVPVIFVIAGGGLLGIGLPLAIWMAISRRRLEDVDVVINRALVYVALSASLAAVYAGLVALASAVSQARSGTAVGLVVTGVVVVLFAPIRSRLQAAVNRLMYGDRGDPNAVLAALGRRLEESAAPDQMLRTTVETVAHALRLSYVAVQLEDGTLAAQHGSGEGGTVEVPLVHAGQRVGTLVVSSEASRRLLDDLSGHVAVAAHAAWLRLALQQSRERIVTAVEEERRRLRRELHDGLGPTLAGVTLGVEAARKKLAKDPVGADAALGKVAEETRAAVADIRRLAHNLRPRALDELGLVGAVREHANHHGVETDGLSVEVESEGDVAGLPAAIEVAAYRIALEAVTNAAKHAGAAHCQVRFVADGDLHVEVRDDGRGLPAEVPPGVGLISMRERAEEVGGSCDIHRGAEGGTVVLARLPIAGQQSRLQ
jgi:signal transduction histidine kinase